jgi:flagellar basal body-associated protein FliL
MKKIVLKVCAVVIPIAVMVAMLLIIKTSVRFFKDTTYSFVYDTNVESVKRFSRELDELDGGGYPENENGGLYEAMIHSYSKTLGEKPDIVTFLIHEASIIHSTAENEKFLEKFLNSDADSNRFFETAGAARSESTVYVKGQMFFYRALSKGEFEHHIFMTVDRDKVEHKLNINRIVIPIAVLGFLLLISIEGVIFLLLEREKIPKPAGGSETPDGKKTGKENPGLNAAETAEPDTDGTA